MKRLLYGVVPVSRPPEVPSTWAEVQLPRDNLHRINTPQSVGLDVSAGL